MVHISRPGPARPAQSVVGHNQPPCPPPRNVQSTSLHAGYASHAIDTPPPPPSTNDINHDTYQLVDHVPWSALTRRYAHGPGIDTPIGWYECIAIHNATRRFLMAD